MKQGMNHQHPTQQKTKATHHTSNIKNGPPHTAAARQPIPKKQPPDQEQTLLLFGSCPITSRGR
jgi:hypothetical protein